MTCLDTIRALQRRRAAAAGRYYPDATAGPMAAGRDTPVPELFPAHVSPLSSGEPRDAINAIYAESAQSGLPAAADPIEAAERDRWSEPPPTPAGIRIVRWVLLPPPIALDFCSVVIEPEGFARSELVLLQAKLRDPRRWTGWSVAQHLERLRQVGVVVEVDL